MLAIWSQLQQLPGVKFLLLTVEQPTPDNADFNLNAFHERRLIQRSAPRSEVPAYLNSADIGFMFRDSHPLNRVASPVKFSEYLASGVAVVTSPDIGDASELVTRERVGTVLSLTDKPAAFRKCAELVEAVRADRAGFRLRARKAAGTYYDWSVYLPAWRQLLARP